MRAKTAGRGAGLDVVSRWAVLAGLVCLTLFLAGTRPAAAAEDGGGLAGRLEFDVNSRYLWRGFAYSEKTALQPYLELSYENWTAWVWGNALMQEQPNRQRFDTFTLYLGREWSVGSWSVTPYFSSYLYPNADESADTNGIGLDTSCPVESLVKGGSFGMSLWIDRKYTPGALFTECSLAVDRSVSPRATASGKLWTGYGSPKYLGDETGIRRSGWYSWGVDVSVEFRLPSGLILRPHAEFSRLMRAEIADATGERDLSNIGLAVGWEF